MYLTRASSQDQTLLFYTAKMPLQRLTSHTLHITLHSERKSKANLPFLPSGVKGLLTSSSQLFEPPMPTTHHTYTRPSLLLDSPSRSSTHRLPISPLNVAQQLSGAQCRTRGIGIPQCPYIDLYSVQEREETGRTGPSVTWRRAVEKATGGCLSEMARSLALRKKGTDVPGCVYRSSFSPRWSYDRVNQRTLSGHFEYRSLGVRAKVGWHKDTNI
ncbi:hypothetical protein IQ07DRAFT_38005 [Pyrenochaeta sp. DS3sAY3a]|nr:hypothetical protein IQ07DRAFT_38005 [Pyrenochaeta sp. DS3sAY3a]